MPKKLDPRLLEVLTRYEEDVASAIWDCHGVWVAYHAAIERIAAKASVVFDMPQIIEANSQSKTVAIAVRGTMGERSEWSFGEAAPANNKNAYPYAMAEKRAKDRVVLKLVGLHGLLYSEEESDDFKAKPAGGEPQQEDATRRVVGFSANGNRTAHSLKKEKAWEEFQADLRDCEIPAHITKLALAWSAKVEADKWPESWKACLREEMEKHMAFLKNRAGDEDEDVFPGDKPNNVRNHPLMAG